MTRLSAEEVLDAIQRQRADQLAPRFKDSEGEKGKSSKSAAKVSRPFHVYPLIALVALLAYVLLGLGWLVGAIGDAIYEIGKRMHDAKWNVE